MNKIENKKMMMSIELQNYRKNIDMKINNVNKTTKKKMKKNKLEKFDGQ